MRGNVARQGIQLQGGWGWAFPLRCLVPPVGALVAVAFGLFPGWEFSLLLAACPLCHLFVIWFARHDVMLDGNLGRGDNARREAGRDVTPAPAGV
jgi:hypothetical protein